MKDKVLEVLKQALPQINFDTSAELIDDGILDSLAIVTMTSELSMEFGVVFDMEDLIPENFNSVEAIVMTVERLMEK